MIRSVYAIDTIKLIIEPAHTHALFETNWHVPVRILFTKRLNICSERMGDEGGGARRQKIIRHPSYTSVHPLHSVNIIIAKRDSSDKCRVLGS